MPTPAAALRRAASSASGDASSRWYASRPPSRKATWSRVRCAQGLSGLGSVQGGTERSSSVQAPSFELHVHRAQLVRCGSGWPHGTAEPGREPRVRRGCGNVSEEQRGQGLDVEIPRHVHPHPDRGSFEGGVRVDCVDDVRPVGEPLRLRAIEAVDHRPGTACSFPQRQRRRVRDDADRADADRVLPRPRAIALQAVDELGDCARLPPRAQEAVGPQPLERQRIRALGACRGSCGRAEQGERPNAPTHRQASSGR